MIVGTNAEKREVCVKVSVAKEATVVIEVMLIAAPVELEMCHQINTTLV